jgi:1,5-anhydro-D-fructose reductase (1,5-anhydro-D-mannitol-forming)
MPDVRWGIIGCGDVAEVKSGPALQKAEGSTLVAVTRRDVARARDYAARHGVPRVHATPRDLIDDPDVDAVYVATPPSSHLEFALAAAAAGKPCLVEKPMAITHAECLRMVDAFAAAGVPLWVAYYRRALPRFLAVRDVLASGAIGRLVAVRASIAAPLAHGQGAANWRFDPATAGGGLFFDLGSHTFDLIDFLAGRIADVSGVAANTGGTYKAEDVAAASFSCDHGVVGTGIWNFNAPAADDELVLTGTAGEITTPILADRDVSVRTAASTRTIHAPNPPHVHQPLVQSIVDELRGAGQCPSTGSTAARASWALEKVVEGYYR